MESLKLLFQLFSTVIKVIVLEYTARCSTSEVIFKFRNFLRPKVLSRSASFDTTRTLIFC